MKNSKLHRRLEKICGEEIPRLADVMFVPHESGFLVFEKFYIHKQKQTWIVEYRTTSREFFSSAVAIAWCIGVHKGDLDIVYNIEKQAKRFEKASDEVKYYNKLISNIKNKDSVQADILQAKMSDSTYRASQAKFELSKCLNIAKYWQTIGFNNETRRPVARKPARPN